MTVVDVDCGKRRDPPLLRRASHSQESSERLPTWTFQESVNP